MAAGLGFKTFTTGEVLTAADTNGYLMQGILVFATEAARNSAITSPQEGQFAFTKDTNSLWYYTGSAWAASGATGDIEGVTAGTGITGGGTSGTVTITNDMATTITAAGDIVVGTGSGTYDNLPIGTTAQVLTADTTVSPYKVKWATPASGSTFVGCSVYKVTTNQSIANDTDTTISFNAEEFDTDAFHNDVTNNSRITIPAGKGGKYLIIAAINFAASATGTRAFKVIKNGSTQLLDNHQQAPTPTLTYRGSMSGIAELVATDYIEVQALQLSGGNLDVRAGQVDTRFAAIYLGA